MTRTKPPQPDPQKVPVPDERPSLDKAVFSFLEILASGCAYEAASAAWEGRPWTTWFPALACALLLFVGGFKWPWIKGKFASVNWVLWRKRINRVVIAVGILCVIALIASGYFFLHGASLFLRDMSHLFSSPSGPNQSAPKEQVPQSPDVPKLRIAPAVLPVRRVDWQDRKNWRKFLQMGLTETQVLQLFGQPREISVSYNVQIWRYGTGEVDFSDGTVWGWDEPID